MDYPPHPLGDIQVPTPEHSHDDTCGEICAYTGEPRTTGSSASHGPQRHRTNREGRTSATTPYTSRAPRGPSIHGAPSYFPQSSVIDAQSHHRPSASLYTHRTDHQYTHRSVYGQTRHPFSQTPTAHREQEPATASDSQQTPGLYQNQWLPSPTLEPMAEPGQEALPPIPEPLMPSRQRTSGHEAAEPGRSHRMQYPPPKL